MILNKYGINYIVFSLDGPGERHDLSRGNPGLYNRILNGIKLTKEIGIVPRISLVSKAEDWDKKAYISWLSSLADRIYSIRQEIPDMLKVLIMRQDSHNIIGNLIDIGNGANKQGTIAKTR